MKKILIKIGNVSNLSEDRNQLEIPFDGEGKYNYQHFIDWLERIGRYGKLQPVKPNLAMEMYYNNIDKGIDYYENMYIADSDILNDLLEEFIYSINKNDYEDLIISPIENINEYDIDDTLTDKGKEEFNKFYRNKLEDELDNNFNFKTNERNLIYVERVITIPSLLNKTFRKNYIDYKDFYRFLNNEYGEHIGQYWSWSEGGSDSYDPQNYSGDYSSIRLKGFVSPYSVEWPETIMKNIYSLSYEQEIFIKYGELIEVNEIIELNNNKKLPLKNTILIKA